MSRVTRSTLRTAAIAALAATSVGFAACGGDDGPQSAEAPTTAPAATTATTPASTTPPKRKEAQIPARVDDSIAVTAEGKKAIDAASEKTLTESQIKASVKRVTGKLDAAGFKSKYNTINPTGPTVITGGKGTTVMVYPSEIMAARQAAGFTIVLAKNKDKRGALIARKGNVMVAVSTAGKLTPELKSEFKKARKVTGV